MRPFETRAAREARERRNKTLLGLFIVVIMVASTVGYVLWGREPAQQQNENIKVYSNYTFTRVEQGWLTEITVENERIQLLSIYLPEELENITIENKPFFHDFKDKVLYIIADDINERQAASKFAFALERVVQRMQLACSEQEANESFCLEQNLPIKGCQDVNIQNAIIVIEETTVNETTATYKDGCLTIKGQDAELIKASEKALFTIFGITK